MALASVRDGYYHHLLELCPWQTLLMDPSTPPGSHGPLVRHSWHTEETSLLLCLLKNDRTKCI